MLRYFWKDDDNDADEMWESWLFLSGVQWIPSPAISSAHYQQPQLPTRWDKHIIFCDIKEKNFLYLFICFWNKLSIWFVPISLLDSDDVPFL